MYSQKKLEKVEKAKDMPFSYKEGSLFISKGINFILKKYKLEKNGIEFFRGFTSR